MRRTFAIPTGAARRCLVRVLSLVLALSVRAHDGSERVESPTSVAEAWNTVELCSSNIETSIAQKQWPEVAMQVWLLTRAAEFLRARSGGEGAARWAELNRVAVDLMQAAHQEQGDEVRALGARLRALREGIEKVSDPLLVHATVYVCPMCRGVRSTDPNATCVQCGMKLVPRTISASTLYNTAGEPTVAMTALLDAPLQPGRASRVRLELTRKKDGAPVTPDDLLVVHTERIHLLIVDESLGDYQHIHPRPSHAPGVYEFSITPERIGPYRVFGDILLVGSSTHEYATCDLPASKRAGDPVSRTGLPTRSTAGGLGFQIDWSRPGPSLPSRQALDALISITGADGKPFTELEPLMGAYAHLVAFHEDRRTVLHVHPLGVEPQKPEDRGGPQLRFRFWAPKSGFYRLYVQVQAGGKQVFAPFALDVR